MAPLRALLLNENIGGHAAMHQHIRATITAHEDVEAHVVDVPPPGLLRKVVGAAIPGLGRLDADLQPLRYQLAQSAWVRRRLGRDVADADVLHAYTQNAVLLDVSTLRLLPTVVGLDSTNEQNSSTLPYRRATAATARATALTKVLERRVFDAATLLVAQSEWAAASLVDDYGVDRARIRVIPYGIVVSEPLPPIARERPRILFVGTSLDRKGGRLLLDVWRSRLRDRADLVLVTLEEVAPEPGLTVLRDVRPGDGKLAEIFRATSVFAFPSEIDKSSYAVVEAMAAGVPVVTTTTGALPELVGDGVAGLLVPPQDGRALADALEHVLADEARRVALGAAARARVAARFDARVTTAAMVAVLHEAVDRYTPR